VSKSGSIYLSAIAEVAKTFGINPKSLLECFFDVDGEPLLERILELTKLSQEQKLPILFQ